MHPPPEVYSTQARYQGLKRRFLMTLCISTLILPIVTYQLFFAGSKESEGEFATPKEVAPDETDPPPLEKAFILGKALGLTEDPRTMPSMHEKALTKAASNWLTLEIPSNERSEVSADVLIAEFRAGYQTGYPDYFDVTLPRKAGHRYALRFDPGLYSCPDTRVLSRRLDFLKADIPEEFTKDPAHWILFKQSFFKGFEEAWYLIEDGVTAKGGEFISLKEALVESLR